MSLLFPNVPVFPGVPPVNRIGGVLGGVLDRVSLLAGDLLGQAETTQWGVFAADGTPRLTADSVYAVEAFREHRIMDYPIEEGGFESYNKVVLPAETRVTITKGGSIGERTAFLTALDDLITSRDLYSVVTSDKTFLDRNLIRYEYRRTAESGATLLTVDLIMMEGRQTVKTATSNTAEPSGADAISGGPVRPETPGVGELPTAATSFSNPTIEALPALTSGDSPFAKAQKLSNIVRAGASVAEMITKGVKFQKIPVLQTAAQSLAVTLGGQPVKVGLAQKAFGLHADVSLNDVPLVSGVSALAEEALTRAPPHKFVGELLLYDKTGAKAVPSFAELGSRFSLLYAGI